MNGVNNSNEWKPLTRLEKRDCAEMIARNRSNQFFLTTHNPYFLAALAEKTPGVDLNIFICYRGGESGTQVRLLTRKEVSGLIEQGAAVFFNLKDYAKS